MTRAPARPRVMGIVNLTPDSFSDGGLHAGAEAGLAHALRLAAEGADILDIGGESTRPGAAPVSAADEMARVLPVIEALGHQAPGLRLSIDTMKPAVVEAAVQAGAWMWNDVTALAADGAPGTAARLGCAVCLMHMKGEPRTMQDAPAYDDVAAEVEAFLLARAEAAMRAGVAREKIWLDPGIGFGKTVAHNLDLIRALPRLGSHGFPILFGASRKRFIGALDGDAPADARLGGSIAAALAAARAGADIVRVHDVRETVQALTVQAAISAS
ncbi:dihydropteroate synthase [Glycocaulis profundi]|nr:dihydropteroate synthase [Glycocaulis profundi]